ncbi:hypothetical protein KR51_00031170 [Rubidibacter lacunae KORDI 51-2]|uniref:Uncharacterized protein n=1 Tax=Rubidibacter lacunae KORDI 51-2 TaxID=582515 RepID=U5DJ04_9CHRO|nr:hypothetical protein KR51_00031170 [Rubidibacter lacunae KORDI 51-2]
MNIALRGFCPFSTPTVLRTQEIDNVALLGDLEPSRRELEMCGSPKLPPRPQIDLRILPGQVHSAIGFRKHPRLPRLLPDPIGCVNTATSV